MSALLIEVKRDRFTLRSTTSEVWVNGEFFCYGLEDTDRKLELGTNQKIHGKSAIPRGTYKVTVTRSTRFKKMLPEVHDVPGFAGIRIHKGNAPDDTEGCLLVGRTRGKDWVGESGLAFDPLFKMIKEAENVRITFS